MNKILSYLIFLSVFYCYGVVPPRPRQNNPKPVKVGQKNTIYIKAPLGAEVSLVYKEGWDAENKPIWRYYDFTSTGSAQKITFDSADKKIFICLNNIKEFHNYIFNTPELNIYEGAAYILKTRNCLSEKIGMFLYFCEKWEKCPKGFKPYKGLCYRIVRNYNFELSRPHLSTVKPAKQSEKPLEPHGRPSEASVSAYSTHVLSALKSFANKVLNR